MVSQKSSSLQSVENRQDTTHKYKGHDWSRSESCKQKSERIMGPHAKYIWKELRIQIACKQAPRGCVHFCTCPCPCWNATNFKCLEMSSFYMNLRKLFFFISQWGVFPRDHHRHGTNHEHVHGRAVGRDRHGKSGAPRSRWQRPTHFPTFLQTASTFTGLCKIRPFSFMLLICNSTFF